MSAPSTRSSSAWIQGPWSDLVLGAGLIYWPIFLLSIPFGPDLSLNGFSLMPFFVIFIANTHLGATLMRVYDRREDRHAYRLFAIWVTLALASLSAVGLWVPIVGSVLMTLYQTFAPWHFTAQNYGVSLVFLRRRGIEVEPALKRSLWQVFTLTFLMWITWLHSAQPGAADYSPVSASGSMYRFLPLGVPQALLPWILCFLGIAWSRAAFQCIQALWGRAPGRELVPAAALGLTQALWFAAPVLGSNFISAERLGPLAGLWSPSNSASTFLWISVVHSAQYLWITNYFVRKERPGTTTHGFLSKSLLAAMAVYGFPLLLLGPSIAGGPSWDAGLYVMLTGALNIHHVILDSAIWKLRNTKVASILLRGDAPPAAARQGRSWTAPVVFASGALGLLLMLGHVFESELGFEPALQRGDVAGIEASLERMAWLGREQASGRSQLAALKVARGDGEGALREYRRSIELYDDPLTWLKLATLLEERGDRPGALVALEGALRNAPDDVELLLTASWLAHELGDDAKARRMLLHASEVAPEHPKVRQALRRVAASNAATGQ
jgi:hypothetical protein